MTRYEADAQDPDAVKAIAEAHGFCLVRNVFSPGEIEKIKAGMKATHETFGDDAPDLSSCPELAWLLFDPRITALARCVLGETLVYYGETSINYEAKIGKFTLAPLAQLHCDAKGIPGSTTKELFSIWRSESDAIYGAYRFGLYFHDYGSSSGALKVGVGTHRGDATSLLEKAGLSGERQTIPFGDQTLNVFAANMPLYDVPARPGDVVIWNLRTIHSAGAKRLRAAPDVALHPKVEKEMFKVMPEAFLPPPGPRIALFFDYGAPGGDVDLYIKHRAYMRAAQRVVNHAQSTLDSSATKERADRLGVILRTDALIAAIALDLREGQIKDVPPAARRLAALLAAHRDFSPFYRPVEIPRFIERARTDPENALIEAVASIGSFCQNLRRAPANA